tara:strand:- start:1667 stop:1891 length:225 start_codon:yes stop_codon:yes gene_type:complete
MYKDILKKAGIKGVKSYKKIYGTKENMFAKTHSGQPDSSWYCEIKDNGKIIVNTKYYDYPKSVIEYNNCNEKQN